MAVDSGALPLYQWAKMSNSPLVQKITKSLYMKGSVLADLSLFTRKTMVMNGTRFTGQSGTMPTINWTTINAAPVATFGVPTPYSESAYLIRNKITLDHILTDDVNNITDPFRAQISIFEDALRYDFNHLFLNNNHTGATGTNLKAPIGIRYRLDNPTLFDMPSELKIDAGALDVSLANATQAKANAFLLLMDKCLQLTQSKDKSGGVFYVNDDLELRINFLARLLGAGAGFSTTKDAYEREITTYKGAQIKNIGRKADQTTQIITSTESSTGADSNSTYTSMYYVYHAEEGFSGWHWGPPGFFGKRQTDDVVINEDTFEYIVGYCPQNNRCCARVYGIKLS